MEAYSHDNDCIAFPFGLCSRTTASERWFIIALAYRYGCDIHYKEDAEPLIFVHSCSRLFGGVMFCHYYKSCTRFRGYCAATDCTLFLLCLLGGKEETCSALQGTGRADGNGWTVYRWVETWIQLEYGEE